MKRLTIKTPEGLALNMDDTYPTEEAARGDLMQKFRDAVNRLSDYEDTGLTPDEVVAMKIVLMGREIARITDFDGVSINRMIELAQAEKEGRLTMLPSNDSLTLDELREMEGEPVWCQSEYRPDGAGWFIVYASAQKPHEFIAVGKERGIPCAGITSGYWKAFRRRPEEGMR